MSWKGKPTLSVNAAKEIHRVDPLLAREPAKTPEVVVVGGVPMTKASDLDWQSVTPRTNPEANKKAERIANARMDTHEATMRAAGFTLTAKLGSFLSVWHDGKEYMMVIPSGPEVL